MRGQVNQLVFASTIILAVGCGSEDKKKVKVTTQLRSAGTTSFSLGSNLDAGSLTAATTAAFLGNSSVTVESFELPIGRINLTAGDNGSGYAEASPNFYACSGSTNEECMVDIVNTKIDDLLKANSGEQEIIFESSKTYTGTAIEICADGKGGPGTTFTAKLKASGVLGADTYYTNATTGVSTTGPAEAISITMSCGGLNTDLVAPVTVTPESTVSLVFWADPAGSVLLTNNGLLVNSNCFKKTATDITFCAEKPAVFGTAVAGAATAERYQMNVTSDTAYGDIIATVISDSAGTPFGASLKQIYTNTADEKKTMHAPLFTLGGVTLADGKYDLMADATTSEKIIAGLPKTGTGTGLKMTKLVDKEITMDSKKL
jgi:hypothetical protein